jgi:hypothetical protein
MAQVWQEIDGGCHFCHSWQDHHERMINAMNIVLDILALTVLVLAFRLLVGYARHDGFARPHRLNTSLYPRL